MMTTFEPISRPHSAAMDSILGTPFPVLDKGFVRLVDYMGDESAIVQAARVSYGQGTKTPSDDIALIRYLLRHHHTTPLEMLEIKLHVKLPVFVARQWIRHRTANVNEYSARYSILDREFYIPAEKDIAKQSKTNKQGRAESFEHKETLAVQFQMRDQADAAFDLYDRHIAPEFDLSREIARIGLPLSTYTQWYWKVDLHNLLNFLRLRADPHAQMEIRVYADAIIEMVKAWVPNVWDAFEDYVRESHTFSRSEMESLRRLLPDGPSVGDYHSDTMSTREIGAFNAALWPAAK